MEAEQSRPKLFLMQSIFPSEMVSKETWIMYCPASSLLQHSVVMFDTLKEFAGYVHTNIYLGLL